MTAKTILALAQTHRSEPSLANYSALADAVKGVVEERERYQRMFQAACVALGEISDVLGCDPDGGGAEPILAAIEELKGEAEKSERRTQAISAVLHNHILAMQAALIDATLESQLDAMDWIFNTLAGPGHLPDIEQAKAMGGAQAWFDAKTAEEEKRVAALKEGTQ